VDSHVAETRPGAASTPEEKPHTFTAPQQAIPLLDG